MRNIYPRYLVSAESRYSGAFMSCCVGHMENFCERCWALRWVWGQQQSSVSWCWDLFRVLFYALCTAPPDNENWFIFRIVRARSADNEHEKFHWLEKAWTRASTCVRCRHNLSSRVFNWSARVECGETTHFIESADRAPSHITRQLTLAFPSLSLSCAHNSSHFGESPSITRKDVELKKKNSFVLSKL